MKKKKKKKTEMRMKKKNTRDCAKFMSATFHIHYPHFLSSTSSKVILGLARLLYVNLVINLEVRVITEIRLLFTFTLCKVRTGLSVFQNKGYSDALVRRLASSLQRKNAIVGRGCEK